VAQIHVMLDLETLGNAPQDGMIVAMGAMAFVMNVPVFIPEDGEYLVANNTRCFYQPIRLHTVEEEWAMPLKIEGETLTWWLEDHDRRELLVGFITSSYAVSLEDAFIELKGWLKQFGDDVVLWSHGATYDCMHLSQKWPLIMGESFNRIIPFRQMRDTRTLFHLYEERYNKSPYPEWLSQRKHHPLSDAYMQTVAVQTAWRALQQ